ncbi:MAG: septal ring lytic transglycosylase RlpA family protein [Xanthomonadales bacterium]|nr:septal ring lytic transglycosylase RlpA family protein [Xanthomonadales bacterium]
MTPPKIVPTLARLTLPLAVLLLAACAGKAPPRRDAATAAPPAYRDSAPPVPIDIASIPEPVPKHEPRARYGNHSPYEVFGRRYHVLPTAEGYRERGIASWYGTKFHGRLTSTREPYDMFQLTAAHKTLPLPAYARVTNLENGRSTIVRINDRGPFVGERIIDLSYAAAVKLGMHIQGTAKVDVQVLMPDDPLPAPETRLAEQPVPTPPTAGEAATAGNGVSVRGIGDDTSTAAIAELPSTPRPVTMDPVSMTLSPDLGPRLWLQLGAFGARENAERLRERLLEAGFSDATVASEDLPQGTVFRVKLGPLADAGGADAVNARLVLSGFDKPRLVTR